MQKENMASIPLFLHILSIFLPSLPVFSHLCLVFAIFAYFSSIFACFGVITQQILPNVKTGITVWHKRMVHQLGRTEMDNLAPPWEDIFLAEQDWVLAERNGWPPLKNDPGTPMAFTTLYIDGSALLLWINLTFVKLDLFAKLADILR